jgi:hypothetical protein
MLHSVCATCLTLFEGAFPFTYKHTHTVCTYQVEEAAAIQTQSHFNNRLADLK